MDGIAFFLEFVKLSNPLSWTTTVRYRKVMIFPLPLFFDLRNLLRLQNHMNLL